MPTTTSEIAGFELDVTFVERGSAIGELLNSTSDGCGSTRASACVGCLTD